jgi:hypothetical protein
MGLPWVDFAAMCAAFAAAIWSADRGHWLLVAIYLWLALRVAEKLTGVV